MLPGVSKPPEFLTFETTAHIESLSAQELSKSPTKSDRSPLSDLIRPKRLDKGEKEKSDKGENTVKRLHRKLVRAQSERCFERSRLPSWRLKEKPLPMKPSPLVIFFVLFLAKKKKKILRLRFFFPFVGANS